MSSYNRFSYRRALILNDQKIAGRTSRMEVNASFSVCIP